MKSIKFTNLYLFLLIFILFSLSACHKKHKTQSFIILSLNDVYRANGLNNGTLGGLARVKTMRDKLIKEGKEVLVLHAGDFLQPSFSARVNQGAAMIDAMNLLDGKPNNLDRNMIVTFGNHEFDKAKMKYLPRLQQRINESDFYWLDSNINWYHDAKLGEISSQKMHKWIIKEINGINVGLFSLTTNMAHPAYVASFDNPIEVTKHYVPFLRKQGADVVIALTHQQLSDDKKVLQLDQRYRPDIIIGGHEHYHQLEQINNTWIVKADADAASVAIIEVLLDKNKQTSFLPIIQELDQDIQKDRAIAQNIKNWQQKTAVKYCQKIKQTTDCLDEAYGSTKVELIAEESEIRRFETNLADFIADTALAEFKLCQADAALINSGSIRLNYNIAANNNITRKHIEGMFPYPSNLKLIQINGKTLKQMLNHAIDRWTANGHWLMVAGIRFVHNPTKQAVSHLVTSSDQTVIADDQMLKIVVPNYLIDAHTDHDGYSMIDASMVIECNKNGSSLKNLLINRIKNTPLGIAPQKDGRICNTLRQRCEAEK